MDLQTLANAADDVDVTETMSEVGSPEEAYEIVDDGSLDFDSWTSIISETERTYSGNIKAISSVYELFLSRFPLCHGYWKHYADHMARLCIVEKAVEIYERAVQSATYSVGLWVDYCSFCILAFADPFDIRRVFERGLSFVGKDFLCHRLWDMYIRFELSQQQWSFLAHILIRALKFPTKSLHKYYDNFREFAAYVEEDMSFSKSGKLVPHAADSSIEAVNFDDEIYHAIKELQASSSVEQRSKALRKYTAIGEQFYHKACQVHEEIDYFENYMETDFFQVEPLDDEQLENWHNYLDFIEKKDDFDWAVKLYERCLIPCANYPEFWMRYVEFMESKGGRELASFALERATEVFLKNVSELHIFNARFREKIGDIEGARAALLLCDTKSDLSFVETAINKANMEKRLGHLDMALDIYDKALKVAAETEKMDIIPILYIHLFRLKYQITGSAGAAIDLLIAGIQQVPNSRLLIEELINFSMMHEGSELLDIVDPVITTAIYRGSDKSQGLSSKDCEDLSLLYLKFVDYCGTTHDIRKAWNRHIKSFPHLIRKTSLDKHPSSWRSNELKQTQEKIPRLVAKQPSHSIISANENHKLLTSKNQAIKRQKPIPDEYEANEDDNSMKENTSFQQFEDNAAQELKLLKNQSKNDTSLMIESPPALHNQGENELQVSLTLDQVRNEAKDDEKEVETRPESLGNLSLCIEEKEQEHAISEQNELHVSQTLDQVRNESNEDNKEVETPPESSRNLLLCTDEKEANDLASKQNETDKHISESLSLSSSLGQQNPQQQIPSQSAQTAQNHDHPNPTNANIETNTWPTSTVPPSTPVQLMVQYPVQSTDEQPVMNPNTQMYNQTWQYQYQMQQWLQMQQSYLMQSQQQPYTQPQQYVPQQQQTPQSQQYPLYQQQEQYQQYWYQMYQQQLQAYMQTQQYQQMPQDLNPNHQHQVTAIVNQIWNGSHGQQGQGAMTPHTTSTHAGVAPRTTQPTDASAPTNIGSPSYRKQSSGPSRSLRSPSLE